MAELGPGVVITGAAGDMGQELAKAYLADGWTVFAADLREIEPRSGLVGMQVDVRHREEVFSLGERAIEESDLRIWINAAGIAAPAAISEADPETWQRTIDVNLTGTFHGCAAALKVMKTQAEVSVSSVARTTGQNGRIVNVGSISGQIGGLGMHPAYGASKAGVHALTKSYALEGSKLGISCNAVAPSVIEGEMAKGFDERQLQAVLRGHPLRRLARMSEVVEVIRFLADERRASYVNGAIVPINGGALMPG